MCYLSSVVGITRRRRHLSPEACIRRRREKGNPRRGNNEYYIPAGFPVGDARRTPHVGASALLSADMLYYIISPRGKAAMLPPTRGIIASGARLVATLAAVEKSNYILTRQLLPVSLFY